MTATHTTAMAVGRLYLEAHELRPLERARVFRTRSKPESTILRIQCEAVRAK